MISGGDKILGQSIHKFADAVYLKAYWFNSIYYSKHYVTWLSHFKNENPGKHYSLN